MIWFFVGRWSRGGGTGPGLVAFVIVWAILIGLMVVDPLLWCPIILAPMAAAILAGWLMKRPGRAQRDTPQAGWSNRR